jgi:hypothetical protein
MRCVLVLAQPAEQRTPAPALTWLPTLAGRVAALGACGAQRRRRPDRRRRPAGRACGPSAECAGRRSRLQPLGAGSGLGGRARQRTAGRRCQRLGTSQQPPGARDVCGPDGLPGALVAAGAALSGRPSCLACMREARPHPCHRGCSVIFNRTRDLASTYGALFSTQPISSLAADQRCVRARMRTVQGHTRAPCVVGASARVLLRARAVTVFEAARGSHTAGRHPRRPTRSSLRRMPSGAMACCRLRCPPWRPH